MSLRFLIFSPRKVQDCDHRILQEHFLRTVDITESARRFFEITFIQILQRRNVLTMLCTIIGCKYPVRHFGPRYTCTQKLNEEKNSRCFRYQIKKHQNIILNIILCRSQLYHSLFLYHIRSFDWGL